MKKFLLLIGFTICGILLTATAQANQINYSGNINDNHTVDYFYFTLSGAGSLDVQLETFNGEFDPVMYLFVDDGNLTTDDYIAHDDDSGTPAQWYDNSKITTNLTAGNYLTAVSDYGFSTSEAINGSNSINYVDDGGYDLVISSGQGTVTTDNAPVPEPSTILLMGIGLLGMVGYSRKRSKKS